MERNRGASQRATPRRRSDESTLANRSRSGSLLVRDRARIASLSGSCLMREREGSSSTPVQPQRIMNAHGMERRQSSTSFGRRPQGIRHGKGVKPVVNEFRSQAARHTAWGGSEASRQRVSVETQANGFGSLELARRSSRAVLVCGELSLYQTQSINRSHLLERVDLRAVEADLRLELRRLT